VSIVSLAWIKRGNKRPRNKTANRRLCPKRRFADIAHIIEYLV
jgi:hypothetical protein